MGRILHSDKTCADIAIHIASEMKKAICREIISSKKKISVLIDESTTLSKKTTLVVAIRTFFANFPGEAYVFNLDLIELSSTTAENITKELLSNLNMHGFDQDFLDECLIAFACDGASAMIGKDSGVATRLQNIFPNLLIWHCANHRLELAVGDVVDEVFGINHFKIFMDKLYALYHQSPKNQNELRQVAGSLETQILKIGRILSVRWVASSMHTVNSVIANYAAMCEHFNRASNDPARDGKEKSKYSGLRKMITNVAFVKNLNAMSDAPDELGDLSTVLQRRNITILEADKAIRTTIPVMDSMATEPGPKLSSAINAIHKKEYKGVPIHDGNVTAINTAQLFRSLANNLRTRMITTSSSHVSRDESHRQENVSTYNQLLENLRVLDPKNWQLTADDEVDIQYGDSHIRQLCHQFHLDERSIIRGFRNYKLNEEKGDREVPEDLHPLFKAIATVPISTSECERNFSSMNNIVTPIRATLNIETIAALLFINCVGPPLSKFNPNSYVRSWLRQGRHSANDAASRKREMKEDTTYEFLWKIL